MTHFERIKNMSIEQLAEILVYYDGGYGVFSGHKIDSFNTEKTAIDAQIKLLESEDTE